jgi:DnaK suppressor protein
MARANAVHDRQRRDVLSRMLRERQSEIRNKLRSLREALPAEAEQVKDAEEQSMQDFTNSMDFALMEMESDTLRRIDEALVRLEENRYGLCIECDERISEERLRAVPFASLCRVCQEQQEASSTTLRPRVAFEDESAGRGRREAAPRLPSGASSLVADMARTMRLSRAPLAH